MICVDGTCGRCDECLGGSDCCCVRCEGHGRIPLGKRFVSREMALDAGEPTMEGTSLGVEWGDCPVCKGTGESAAEKEEPKP